MKKIICLSQRIIDNHSYKERRNTLDFKYIDMIKELNSIPLIIPTNYDVKEYLKNFEVSGLILTGGNDLYSCDNNELSLIRDKHEKELIKYCIFNNIPILGICRGMQVIADYFGSSFIASKGQVGTYHKLIINRNSKYLKELEILTEVNSYHNYAIDILSEELIVSAYNKEGVIKALEHKNLRIFGHMWHPERSSFFKKEELSLIRKFFYDK